jgi:hypothetical protein
MDSVDLSLFFLLFFLLRLLDYLLAMLAGSPHIARIRRNEPRACVMLRRSVAYLNIRKAALSAMTTVRRPRVHAELAAAAGREVDR